MAHKIFLFFFFLFMLSSIFGQLIQPSLLEMHKKKICLKETKKSYSGVIEGYLYYRDLRPVHAVMLQIKGLLFNANYQDLDSFPSTPYIKGYVVDGKAEWEWKIYQVKDSILLAEASFVKGKLDGAVIIYDVFNIFENQPIIFYYRRGKFLFLE